MVDVPLKDSTRQSITFIIAEMTGHTHFLKWQTKPAFLKFHPDLNERILISVYIYILL